MKDYYDKFGNLIEVGSVILFKGMGKRSYNTIGVVTILGEESDKFRFQVQFFWADMYDHQPKKSIHHLSGDKADNVICIKKDAINFSNMENIHDKYSIKYTYMISELEEINSKTINALMRELKKNPILNLTSL